MIRLGRRAQALLLLVGTIVGAGMFAVPFVFQRSGFLTGALALALLAAAVAIVHLAYAEVVQATPDIHRLPGYVRRYLGRAPGWLASASYLFGLSGALLAYLVLGGSFLGELIGWVLPTAPASAGPIAFYLAGVLVISRGIRFEGLTDAILTLGLVAAILILGLSLLPRISLASLAGFHPGRLAVPYGVILFSLAGSAVIPDLRRLLGGRGQAGLGRIVAAGTLASAGLYLVFAAAVVGVTGAATAPDAISGLAAKFGTPYLLLGSAIGVLATITSFIALGVVLEGTFVSDFRIRPRLAWLTTAAIPAVLWGFGFQDFIAIISVVGAVGIGLDSILILLVQRKLAPIGLRIGAPARLLLIAVFGLGVLQELSSFLTLER